MELWIARERNWQLYGHEDKPVLENDEWVSMGALYYLDTNLFPKITFENSPQKIELKLKD